MRLLFAIALFTCLLAACGAPAGEPEVVASPVAELPTAEAPTPTETAEPTETPLSPTATPEPLTPSEIFTRLSPSAAYISVPGSSGSGALIDGGYIVTNYHIVWPHTAADVTFPDGAKFDDVALVAADPLLDLALLGPIEVDLPPIAFVDGESAVVGGDILLIGYPGESSRSPQPTLTEGLISRVREWEEGGVTFFQTSSAVAGGQSGGIAVSPEGQAVGLSGLRFTEANYGLIASAADLLPVIDAWREIKPAAAPTPKAIKTERWNFQTIHDLRVYRIDEPDTDVTVTVDGPTDVVLAVVDPFGRELTYSDNNLYGEEKVTFTTPADGTPLFVMADYEQQYSGQMIPFTMRSNVPLMLMEDKDDGQTLRMGQVYTGTMDHPYDADAFEMILSSGQIVNIRVDAIGLDPMLIIDPGMGSELMVLDDDSGGGLFDNSAEMTYQAPRGGTYTIAVYDLLGNAGGGGYTVTVGEPGEGAPTPTAPEPTPTPLTSSFGRMRVFDDPTIPFTIQMPFHFVNYPKTVSCRTWSGLVESVACLSDSSPSGDQLTMLLLVEDFKAAGVPDLTLDELADIIRGFLEQNSAYTGITQTTIETADGEPAIVLKAEIEVMGVNMTRLLTVDPIAKEGHYVTFIHSAEEQEIVDYLISTFSER